jgi:GDSL-like Lipase/Acylhydrolase family
MTARFKIGALVLGLLVAVGLVEISLRAMNMGFGNSPMEPDPYLHHVHPKNYSFVQQHPSGELGGFEIHYDASGRVVRNSPIKIDIPTTAAPCRIALMGDSFTEAGQVPFDQSFAGLLEEAARRSCEVRNYGVRSYSPAIYLVQWTRDVEPWHPTHVFLLLFGNDVREDVTYMSTAVMGSDGLPTAIQGPEDGWLFAQLRRSYLARFVRMVGMRASWTMGHGNEAQWTVGGVVEEHPDWGGPTPGLVSEINRRVRASGAQLIVMAVPSRYLLMGDGKIKIEGQDFHQTVKAWAQTQGMDFLDLHRPFERASRAGVPLFFLQDIHFTAEGNALVAATIARQFPAFFADGSAITSKSVQAAFGDSPR